MEGYFLPEKIVALSCLGKSPNATTNLSILLQWLLKSEMNM